mgnify:CR=1 FL=1
MNELYQSIGKTLYVNDVHWGIVTDTRVKYGNQTIQLIIDDTLVFDVNPEKLTTHKIKVI